VGATLQSRLGTNTPLVFLESPGNSANPGANATISLYGAPQTSNGDVLSEAIVDASRTWINSTTGWITGAWIKEAETWHTPTYNASWAGTTTFSGIASAQTLRYRYDAEDNTWIEGAFTATGAAGAIPFALPSGYYDPNKIHMFPVMERQAGGGAFQVGAGYVGTTGNFHIDIGCNFTRNNGDAYYVNAKIPLGNV
jgi:hypothetical protein